MQDTKPFAKTEQKVMTVTIDEEGNLLYLKTSEHDIFAEMGEVVTKRASHVEPSEFWLRMAFRFLRVFGDKTRVAKWTRGWGCLWRVNTKPVGGPILTWEHVEGFPRTSLSWWYIFDGYKQTATWRNRQDAIDAEIKFLNQFFLERGIQ